MGRTGSPGLFTHVYQLACVRFMTLNYSRVSGPDFNICCQSEI